MFLRRGHLKLMISIHAPREGGDVIVNGQKLSKINFNPRPPRGGRHRPLSKEKLPISFQSTPPARGATLCFAPGSCHFMISIHAPREGGDV